MLQGTTTTNSVLLIHPLLFYLQFTGAGRAAAVKTDEEGGLDSEVFHAEGAAVMLTSNLSQDVGLCNGASGIVQSVLYPPNKGPPSLPIAVLVHFPHYTGPAFTASNPQSLLIPPEPF